MQLLVLKYRKKVITTLSTNARKDKKSSNPKIYNVILSDAQVGGGEQVVPGLDQETRRTVWHVEQADWSATIPLTKDFQICEPHTSIVTDLWTGYQRRCSVCKNLLLSLNWFSI